MPALLSQFAVQRRDNKFSNAPKAILLRLARTASQSYLPQF